MNDDSIRDRVTRQGEETLGRLAQELLDNPVVSGALSAAFETRERAMRAQEVAMGALNLPSAADLERLTRRVRSVSQRLEGIEDGLDRIDDRMTRGSSAGGGGDLEDRLTRIEAVLARLEATRAEQTAAAVAAAEVAAVEAVAAEEAAGAAAQAARSGGASASRSGGGTTARSAAKKPARSAARKPASGGSSRSSARKPAAKRSSGQRRSS